MASCRDPPGVRKRILQRREFTKKMNALTVGTTPQRRHVRSPVRYEERTQLLTMLHSVPREQQQ